MSVSPTAPASFQPLDGSNGVPGDAGDVTDLARRYADTAAEIEAQAAQLERLTSRSQQGWKGQAGENVVEVAGELAERILTAKDRYAAAARALSHFGNRLDDLQRTAYAAVRNAQEAVEEQRALSSSAPTAPGVDATPEQLALATEDRRRHQDAVDAAATRLGDARERYEQAVEDYHDLAEEAARILREGRADDGLADSWWDKHADFLSAVLDAIGAIVLVLTIAALVIGVFATGGLLAAAVPVLMAIGAGLTAISFGGHLALWLTDNGSGADVLWDLAGLLTFGLGAGVGRAARGLTGVASRVGGRVAGASAGRAAFTSTGRSGLLYDAARRVPFGQQILSVSPGLRAAFTTADEQATAARGAVEALAMAPSTRLSRLLALGDRAPAQSFTAINQIITRVPDSEVAWALGRLAQGMTIAGVTAPGLVTGIQGGLDTYGDYVSEPAQEATDQKVRAEIVDQWSMPLMHLR
ncbi:hypothetical protein DQ237_08865 [Blastococcus sp. TF02-8]|uniref:hypothetical protein n=1 Tax=Blastococcus sp. TF02-8 TaxID=2250574 RepID=UPI000DE9C22D|nr:hypothetical protein [Blastococcus sp. TF02-8]RBY96705.1 hypothetical protein DQ237_08865 [Blastococcus sp. TF02-8]